MRGLEVIDIPNGCSYNGLGIGYYKKDEWIPLKGDEKMGYNADNAAEIPAAKVGTQIDAVIIEVKDGKTRDFVSDDALKSWKGAIDAPAIQVTAEGKYNDFSVKTKEMFNYTEGLDGVVKYPAMGKMSRFKTMYESLPKIGLKVTLEMGSKGFWKLKIPE